MKQLLTSILLMLIFACRHVDNFTQRTIILDNNLGTIMLILPTECDSFYHKSGEIIQDSLKGEGYLQAKYSYSTTNKNRTESIMVSFRHRPIDDFINASQFDISTCVSFLSVNPERFHLEHTIERSCVTVGDRYFAIETRGIQKGTETEISMTGYTYIKKRVLETTIRLVSTDTTGAYRNIHRILNSISIM